MTHEEAYEKMVQFRIRSFADMCKQIAGESTYDSLSFADKIALAVEAEDDARHERRVARRNKEAGFANPMACIEDIIYIPERTLSIDTIQRLSSCAYIEDGRNVIVTSVTGCGKSYLVQALGNAACRNSYKVKYIRHADLDRRISIARREDRHYDVIQSFEETDLLILDDLFLEESNMANVTDLLEIVTHRIDACRSIMIASQLTPEQWHLRIETKIIADALLDRVVQNSLSIEIDGPNMRAYCATKYE